MGLGVGFWETRVSPRPPPASVSAFRAHDPPMPRGSMHPNRGAHVCMGRTHDAARRCSAPAPKRAKREHGRTLRRMIHVTRTLLAVEEQEEDGTSSSSSSSHGHVLSCGTTVVGVCHARA
eukprot:2573302-Prymnesium_polylepis.2